MPATLSPAEELALREQLANVIFEQFDFLLEHWIEGDCTKEDDCRNCGRFGIIKDLLMSSYQINSTNFTRTLARIRADKEQNDSIENEANES